MKKKLTKRDYILASIILYVINFVVTGFTTKYIWNNILAVVLELTTINFWQGWAVGLGICYFLPRPDKKITDYVEYILDDLSYTLTIWFFAFLAVTFIRF